MGKFGHFEKEIFIAFGKNVGCVNPVPTILTCFNDFKLRVTKVELRFNEEFKLQFWPVGEPLETI